jgi:hypothetical protein
LLHHGSLGSVSPLDKIVRMLRSISAEWGNEIIEDELRT